MPTSSSRAIASAVAGWIYLALLAQYLVRNKLVAIGHIDTRRLTRHLRDAGALPGAFGADEHATRAAAVADRLVAAPAPSARTSRRWSRPAP